MAWFFLILMMGSFLVFMISYLRERRKLINGFFFNVFLIFLFFELIGILVQFEQHSIFSLMLLFIAILLLFVLLFGVFGLIFFLFWNSRVVRKRESVSLANLLTFILASGLSAWWIFVIAVPSNVLPKPIELTLGIIPIITFYFLCGFFNYLSASFVYQFPKPKYDQDFLVVLGSGLIDGDRVSPLLASRIDKAIEFYKKQVSATGKKAKLIFSGGQGSDEKISEGLAMANYARSKGILEDQFWIEDQSKTTYENMLFSKKMLIDGGMQDSQGLFFTNNYHVFRASLFAKAAGLCAQGVGAKTAFYFLPNALIREYIAIVMLRKKRHLFIIGLLAVVIIARIVFYYISKN